MMGLVQHFVNAKPCLKPYITPIIRASDRFPLDTMCVGKHTPVFRKILIREGQSLHKCLIFIMEIATMNCFIPFQRAFRICEPRSCNQVYNFYCDAAGAPSEHNHHSFGMGRICYDLGFAWQCPRKNYVHFLIGAKDTQPDKLHINVEELLAQQLGKYLLTNQFTDLFPIKIADDEKFDDDETKSNGSETSSSTTTGV